MATIRLLCRPLNQLNCKPVGAVRASSLWTSSGRSPELMKQWPQSTIMTGIGVGGGSGGHRVVPIGNSHHQQWFRPMSYVSNIRRMSGRHRQTIRLLAVGVAVGSAILLVETVYQRLRLNWRQSRRPLSSAAQVLAAEDVPQSVVSRAVTGPTDLGLKFTLYQYQSCPFCCKVRAFLDYYGIPYNVVEVNPLMRQQLKFSKYRKVPVLLVQRDGDSEVLQINDSTTIVSALSSFMISRRPDSKHSNETIKSIAQWYHEKEVQREDGVKVDEIINRYFLMFGDIEKRRLDSIEGSVAEERNWRRWADDHMVHMLSPNIYRTIPEAVKSFEYFARIGDWDTNFKTWEKYLCVYVGSGAMYWIGKRLKKKYQLTDDVRESLYQSSRHWLKAIGKDRRFMGGATPNLADLAVYGVLNSIEGCDAFTDLLDKTRIGLWYYSVKELVKNKAGINQLDYLKANQN